MHRPASIASARALACLAFALAPRVALAGDPLPYPLAGGDFEDATLDGAWRSAGRVSASASGMYGRRGLALGPGDARLAQDLDVAAQGGAPAAGDVPQAALWFAALPASGAGSLEIALWAETEQGEALLLAHEEVWLAEPSDSPWTWLATDPAATQALPAEARSLRLEVRASGDRPIRVDFAEVGPAGTVHGLPRRLALASYATWYRSPLAEEASGDSTFPRVLWENWAWLDGPSCDPTDSSLVHDPDCATSGRCFRSNGRRDGAVSTLTSLDELPLAGLYDSRDPDLVRYHVELARAIGLDAFVVDWYGMLLAEQDVLPGEAPIGERALAELFVAAEELGAGFKIGIMYEPKVHMSGWVSGETSFAAKKAGIVTDLAWFAERFSTHGSLLRRDGKPVVFVFGQEACTSSGACLDDADWADIVSSVRSATGVELYLVATDVPTSSTTSFSGLLRWGLVAPPILRYASYADFVARQEKWPPATVADLLAHARLLASITRGWTSQAPGRLAVGIVWPGFDDSGVAGWSVSNGTGDDGQPLCVRVCDPLDGAFLPTTFEGAMSPDAPDWLHVCTFNDWNEDTAIEPRWNATYFDDVRARRASSQTTLESVFERALGTQEGLAIYKGPLGTDLDPRAIEAAARAYLEEQIAGGATLYD
jgi:hypothetical protein